MEKQTSVSALLCVVWSAVAAIQVDIPKKEYEFIRGDNITLPCTFKTTLSNPPIVIISWSATGPDTPADETLFLAHYHPAGLTDISPKYEGRVSVDVNVTSGKADLKLSSITMADNKEFECRLQIPGDDEGQPADTARLTVLDLKVNIPKDEYEFVRGDNITLPCTFKSAQRNPPFVIITWSAESPDTPAKETLILIHYHPIGLTDISPKYEGRVSVDVNVASGKADLKLSSITMAENKEFECHVQIPGDDEGQPADTAHLTVLVPPSPPICWTQGKAEYGQNISLTCNSMEGFPPPSYRWESWDMLNISAQDSRTDIGGTLSLYDISRNTSGIYICTSSNKVQSVKCSIVLHVMPPPSSINSITRIITRAVAILIISLIVIAVASKNSRTRCNIT